MAKNRRRGDRNSAVSTVCVYVWSEVEGGGGGEGGGVLDDKVITSSYSLFCEC